MLTNLNVIPFSSPDQVVITLSILNDLYMLFFDNVTHADQMKNNEKMNVSQVCILPFIFEYRIVDEFVLFTITHTEL